MKQEISYKNKTDRDAVIDILRYVETFKRFKQVVKAAQIYKIHEFTIACSFAGIEGFPVGAMHRRYNKK